MPSYKLVYFNLRGRAELPRLMFAAAGVEYEDCRIESADWPKEKAKTPFGQVPVLMIDGKPLPQTGAIVRYLARELKLDGDNGLMQAYTDMIRETLTGLFENMPFSEKDEKKKEQIMKEIYDNKICPTFEKMEKKFAEEKKEFLVGKRLTYADLAMMDSMTTLETMYPGFMKKYPCLKKLCDDVQAQKGVAAWLEKRPKTSF